MDDAGPVRRLHRAGQLDTRREDPLDAEPLGTRAGGQVGRRVVLHDEVGAPVLGRARPEDLDDEGVVGQVGHRVGLVDELPLQGVGEALALEHLDRDRHARHVLLVEVDVCVAAGAQRLDVGQARQVRRQRDAHGPTS